MTNYNKEGLVEIKDDILLRCRQAVNQSDNLGDLLDEIELSFIDFAFLINEAKQGEELTQIDLAEIDEIFQEVKNAREFLETHVKSKFASL